MLTTTSKALTCVVLAVITVGCSQSTNENSPAAGVRSELLLSTQPTDAKPVADVRESAKDGDEVSVLGRIGGSVNPWVEGRAAFTIVDPKLNPCDADEGCPTPWDYCCSTDELADNRAMIKFVDGSGGTVDQDARKLLGLKELQTIVVKGTAKRDEAGNLTVLASGVYVVPDVK